jgi:hypothetical protein
MGHYHVQGVPFKIGLFARRNQERILFDLVFGSLNGASGGAVG